MVWARKVRQVERRIAVCIAAAEGANQFALCRWRIPEAAVTIRHTVVTTCRVSVEVIKRVGVGVERKRRRDTAICVSQWRRPARCTWTRRGSLRGIAAAISAATATAASVMAGALANHVGFHRNWTGGAMKFETW